MKRIKKKAQAAALFAKIELYRRSRPFAPVQGHKETLQGLGFEVEEIGTPPRNPDTGERYPGGARLQIAFTHVVNNVDLGDTPAEVKANLENEVAAKGGLLLYKGTYQLAGEIMDGYRLIKVLTKNKLARFTCLVAHPYKTSLKAVAVDAIDVDPNALPEQFSL